MHVRSRGGVQVRGVAWQVPRRRAKVPFAKRRLLIAARVISGAARREEQHVRQRARHGDGGSFSSLGGLGLPLSPLLSAKTNVGG